MQKVPFTGDIPDMPTLADDILTLCENGRNVFASIPKDFDITIPSNAFISFDDILMLASNGLGISNSTGKNDENVEMGIGSIKPLFFVILYLNSYRTAIDCRCQWL